MSYFDKEEMEAFLDVFLSNSGSEMDKKVAVAFLNDLHSPDMDEEYMREHHLPSTYTLVVDALNTWHAGVRFAWGKAAKEIK